MLSTTNDRNDSKNSYTNTSAETKRQNYYKFTKYTTPFTVSHFLRGLLSNAFIMQENALTVSEHRESGTLYHELR
jgi:hypothetical protein